MLPMNMLAMAKVAAILAGVEIVPKYDGAALQCSFGSESRFYVLQVTGDLVDFCPQWSEYGRSFAPGECPEFFGRVVIRDAGQLGIVFRTLEFGVDSYALRTPVQGGHATLIEVMNPAREDMKPPVFKIQGECKEAF